MELDLVIKNGTVVTATATYQADIGVRGERIVAIGEELNGERKIDAAGKLVTPGAVDMHVHLQMPIGNFVSSDDFYSGTRAAAFGGTTTIIDFVEAGPDQSMVEAISARRALADPKVVIDYGLHMTIGPAEIAKLEQLPAAVEAGCVTFKLYMAYALCLSDSQLMQALEAIGDVNGLPVVHAENWDVICALVARNLAAGNTKPYWHPLSRPPAMEGEAAGRVIDIATMTGTRLHIFHVSCAEVVERIARARGHGLAVTGETCPQYLLLTQDVYDRPGLGGALPICSPPIRDLEQQRALWKALGDEKLQVISTDHCPFMAAEKATGLHDYSQIPGGVPSIEMRFPAIYTFGVRTGHMTPNQWVAACCTIPARLAGLENKGDIAIGYDADLVVFDPDASLVLSTDTLHENVDWTLYDDVALQGWPAVTVSRGRVLVEGGEFSGRPGLGRYVNRSFK
jgi:dihydropyrimidinase